MGVAITLFRPSFVASYINSKLFKMMIESYAFINTSFIPHKFYKQFHHGILVHGGSIPSPPESIVGKDHIMHLPVTQQFLPSGTLPLDPGKQAIPTCWFI